MKNVFEEIIDEAADFLEDFLELIGRSKHHKITKQNKIVVNGVAVTVRPAYAFAERIDNILKLIFGVSLIASAATASVLGFSSISELVKVLIFTIAGRIIMLVIGMSYFTIAVWRLLHIEKDLKSKESDISKHN